MEDQDLLMMMLMKPQTLITQTSMPMIMTPTSTSTSTTTSSSSSLAMHKSSHTISKPKIRIIHIFAPEIIKTDAANFRELVQRLTGKPAASDKIKRPRRSRYHHKDEAVKKVDINNNINVDIRSSAATVKEEESNDFQMWSNNSNNNNSLFGGGFLGDLEGFNVQEFGDFSFLPHTIHAFDQDPHLIT